MFNVTQRKGNKKNNLVLTTLADNYFWLGPKPKQKKSCGDGINHTECRELLKASRTTPFLQPTVALVPPFTVFEMHNNSVITMNAAGSPSSASDETLTLFLFLSSHAYRLFLCEDAAGCAT
jgi:hypothetical protein